MKITYDWLKDHLKTNKSEKNLVDKLTDIGLEVESIDDVSTDLDKFLIVKIDSKRGNVIVSRRAILEKSGGFSFKMFAVLFCIKTSLPWYGYKSICDTNNCFSAAQK